MGLKEIGATLYLCEGTKERIYRYKRKGRNRKRTERRVEFCNSNPKAVTKFLAYLRSFGIDEAKMIARLFIHGNSDEKAKKYWSEITGIPPEQFMKTSWRKPSKWCKKRLPYGTIAIRYNNADLLKKIMKDIEDIFP